jgi:hypothetical protein
MSSCLLNVAPGSAVDLRLPLMTLSYFARGDVIHRVM